MRLPSRSSFLTRLAFCACILLAPKFVRAEASSATQLYDAVVFQDLPAIQKLLASGANPNYRQNGRPLLGWAAQSGSVEVVQALLSGGANPNEADDGGGHTPLMRAIDTQQVAIVRALLKGKANPNAATKDGKTCLMMAAESRKPEIVKALIEGGVDVKQVGAEGDSPALVAAQDNMPESLEIIRLLGKSGADLNASNAAYTPLMYAAEQGNKDLVQALLDAGANPNTPTSTGRLPILRAIENPEILAMFIRAKADLNVMSSSGTTPLLEAIENNYFDSVKALIAAGANTAKPSQSGTTPLQLAEQYSRAEMVELLKKSAGDAQTSDSTVGGYKVFPIGDSSKGCTIVDAARKQMEIHGLLQAQVNAGKMDSDIFRTFNEDTKDYARLLTENPPEACALLERLRTKYGV